MTASSIGLSRDARRVKIITQRVRLGAKEFRVISPARPLNNGALYDAGREYAMYIDRPDGHRIGALWLLAARSPRSLVYLPMRATPSPADAEWDGENARPLDLVLAHHSLQFPPSSWKEVRRRITAGNAHREPRTASVPATDLPTSEETGDHAPNHRDVLRSHVHAETLFLIGSSMPFRESARDIYAVTKHGPPAAATSLYINGACNYHVCRTIWWPRFDLRDGRYIHVEYCPPWTR